MSDPMYKLNEIKRDEYNRPSGVVAINKPADVTSHDLVNELRKKLGTRKVGHAGALDVFADGVMIYLIGKATKQSDKLIHLDKEYVTTILLGVSTESQDTEGKITEIKTGYKIKDISDIDSKLTKFVGDQKQYVSAYSSVKVSGKKLRNIMRDDKYDKIIQFNDKNEKIISLTPKNSDSQTKNVEVIIPSKKIKIYELELLESGDIPVSKLKSIKKQLTNIPGSQTFPFVKIRVKSSKGTYIRQLAEDIGQELNMPAMLLNLTRTRVGDISLEKCIALDNIN